MLMIPTVSQSLRVLLEYLVKALRKKHANKKLTDVKYIRHLLSSTNVDESVKSMLTFSLEQYKSLSSSVHKASENEIANSIHNIDKNQRTNWIAIFKYVYEKEPEFRSESGLELQL